MNISAWNTTANPSAAAVLQPQMALVAYGKTLHAVGSLDSRDCGRQDFDTDILNPPPES